MKVLIPVKYPLTDMNIRAIQRGESLAMNSEDAELLIFYLNEVHSTRNVTRKSLRKAVESAIGDIHANYVVRDGYIVEEAIIELAIELGMDCIILSTHRRNRWQRLLRDFLGIDENPAQLLEEATGITVHVVGDSDEE